MVTNQNQLNMLKISKRASGLIKENGCTQREVAEAIGLSEQVFSNKLTGVRSFTMKDISVLADFFKVSTDYLLGRIDTLWPIVGGGPGSESADDEVRCP